MRKQEAAEAAEKAAAEKAAVDKAAAKKAAAEAAAKAAAAAAAAEAAAREAAAARERERSSDETADGGVLPSAASSSLLDDAEFDSATRAAIEASLRDDGRPGSRRDSQSNEEWQAAKEVAEKKRKGKRSGQVGFARVGVSHHSPFSCEGVTREGSVGRGRGGTLLGRY